MLLFRFFFLSLSFGPCPAQGKHGRDVRNRARLGVRVQILLRQGEDSSSTLFIPYILYTVRVLLLAVSSVCAIYKKACTGRGRRVGTSDHGLSRRSSSVKYPFCELNWKSDGDN